MARKSASKMLRIEEEKVPDVVLDPVPDVTLEEEPEPEPEFEPIIEVEMAQATPVWEFKSEDMIYITTLPHSGLYNHADLTQPLRLHMTNPETFLCFDRRHKDKYRKTMFYEIAEGPLTGKFIDSQTIKSAQKLR